MEWTMQGSIVHTSQQHNLLAQGDFDRMLVCKVEVGKGMFVDRTEHRVSSAASLQLPAA